MRVLVHKRKGLTARRAVIAIIQILAALTCYGIGNRKRMQEPKGFFF